MLGRLVNSLALEARKDSNKKRKSYRVHFKSKWFSEYKKWLCSSTMLHKLFCLPCLFFGTKKVSGVWNKEGFDGLLNINRSFRFHGDSAEHIQWKCLRKTAIPLTMLFRRMQDYTLPITMRMCVLIDLFLKVVIDAVLYLSDQELPFRGHDESVSHESGKF